MELQRVRHDWAIEEQWKKKKKTWHISNYGSEHTELNNNKKIYIHDMKPYILNILVWSKFICDDLNSYFIWGKENEGWGES